MTIFCDNCGKENRDVAKFCIVCGNALEQTVISTGPLPKGIKLDERITIIELIKAGGMGAVYKASYDKLHKICAVKELLPSYGTPEELNRATEWFKREARLLAKLDHPNLPGFVDCFVCNSRYYIVMNFIEGDDLENRLEKEGAPGLPEKDIVDWSKQVLEVLDYLHNQKPPIIYRDLKPGNIMITKEGRAILIDFGIARVVPDYGRARKTAVGTNGYASVEQCRGHAEPRSDLYGLAATMHHLLTGVEPLPFKFEPVRKIIPTVSPNLEYIIMKALKEKIDDRFPSAKEMLKALNVFFPAGKSIVAISSAGRQPTRQLRKPGKKFWEFTMGGSVSSSPAVFEQHVYFGSSDKKLYCVQSKTGGKIWDFDTGSYTFLSSPCIKEGFVYYGSGKNLYCLDAKTGKKIWSFETILGFQCSLRVVDECVYFGSTEKKLYCLNARDGSKIWEFETGGCVVSSPFICEGFIFVGSDDYTFYCLDAKEGKKVWEFKTGGMIKSSPCVREGYVYFGSNDKTLYCMDIKRGKKVWEFKTGFWVSSSPYVVDGYVYFGSDDKKIYSFESKTGAKNWHFQCENRIGSSPCIVNGFVYFGCCDKRFYCLDTRNGKKQIH
ncbi:MAG: Serine/threonine-protein kinase PknB [bacterium ADurb.Bin363]|nr:MAG: Serine/threonine-protein kinase PknB [bacterium ADurb.Bin363]